MKRPIIFIAHNLGGIVVKSVSNTAYYCLEKTNLKYTRL